MGLPYLFSLLNSQNTSTLRSTMINQCSNVIYHVSGSGITTEQQKKTWLINWYFANDPMGSIYLATLRNPALVASYQTSPGMLYGANGAAGMETYFIKIKTHFGQSMFDQLVTEFAQQSNLYVDEIKVDEFHMYGSSRLGVYESNKLISKRVARDLNLDNQITSNEYVIETPEEVTYLFSSYQLERGAKRYELANHLGNVLTVISDKKTAVFTGTSFNYFAAERVSATDYSPGGTLLVGRSFTIPNTSYRFGFNKGSENVDEISSAGTHFTTLFREGDTRLLIWWGVDPKAKELPWQSPYSYMDGNPIKNNDPNGDVVPLLTMGIGGAIGIGVGLYDLSIKKDGKGNTLGLGNALNKLWDGDEKAWKHIGLTTLTGVALGSGVGVVPAMEIAFCSNLIDQKIQNDGLINPYELCASTLLAGAGNAMGPLMYKTLFKPVTKEAGMLFESVTTFPKNNIVKVAGAELGLGLANTVTEKTVANYTPTPLAPNTNNAPTKQTTKKATGWATSLPVSTSNASSVIKPSPIAGRKKTATFSTSLPQAN
jgi:hypothetical protein